MALTVKDIEYASGAAGFAAMRADMEAAYVWDETTLDEENGVAAFRKYLDDTQTGYIEISLTQHTDHPPAGTVKLFTGAAEYGGFSFSGSGSYVMQYAHWAVGEGRFALYGGRQQVPSTNQYSGFVGLFPCRNPETGKQSVCAVVSSGEMSLHVLGETLTGTGSCGFVMSLYEGSQLAITAPVCTNLCKEVAEGIQFLLATPEGYLSNVGYRNFAGTEHYLMGRFLLVVE